MKNSAPSRRLRTPSIRPRSEPSGDSIILGQFGFQFRDRDGKLTTALDEIFAKNGTRVVRTPTRTGKNTAPDIGAEIGGSSRVSL